MKYGSIIICALFVSSFSFSKLATQTTNADVTALPVLLQNNAAPKVMIAMGYDHQLFVKAYSDHSDLNNDGKLDVTYQDDIEYTGYFNSDYCYVYQDNGDIDFFKADSKVINGTHQCSEFSDDFSGNFLNWVSMTRIDIIRSVLFGGKRLVDDIEQTIVTRAFLPQDSHSFTKVFKRENGKYLPNNDSFSGVSEKYVTFCNTSLSGDPVILAANGAFPKWASNEKKQCVYDNSYSTPTIGDEYDRWLANVQVCDQLTNSSVSCQQYKNGNFKPKGLLQEYAESGNIEFGMISGSQINPHSGGVLRKNIEKIAGNVNSALDEINLNTGQFNAVNGIISNINAMRMIGVKDSIHANCNDYLISKADYLSKKSTPEGFNNSALNTSCSDWGNPIAEIYLEALRYFSGQTSATPSFIESQYKDSDFVENLTIEEKWKNNINEQTDCSNCAVLVISAGQNSFDQDDLVDNGLVLPELGSLSELNKVIDRVGQMQFDEKFTDSGPYLNGENGHCESKSLTGLSQVKGVCPDLPFLEGGYAISGLSYYSATSGFNNQLQDKQTINTYVLQLAQNLPKFSVDISTNQSIEILPVCQARKRNEDTYTPCSLVNVDILSQEVTQDGLSKKLKIHLYWEDSLWGGDYDLDATQEIEICVGPDYCSDASVLLNEIKIKNGIVSFSTNDVRLSFNVVGSTDDGVSENWITYNDQWFDLLDPDSNIQNTSVFSNSAQYQIGQSSVTALPTPLWLAAKFGGFDDVNNDGVISSQLQWDKRNNITGQNGADGVPDHYFTGFNPTNLAQQLKLLFVDVSNNKNSTNQVSLQHDPLSNVSIVYQSSYFQTKQANQETVNWVGELQAFFVDESGYIREDSDFNKTLTANDYIIQTVNVEGALYFQRYQWIENSLTAVGELQSIDKVKPLWSASDFLSKDAKIFYASSQREYNIKENKRYIFTHIDNQTYDFIADDNLKNVDHYFSLSETDVNINDLVDYIRGVEIEGTRNRALDIDSQQTVFRLGDIIHSSTHLMRAPSDAYLNNIDSSYAAFKNQYKDRRDVVFVGANDGMLHAFNAGFWDESSRKINTTNSDENVVDYDLGAELWAFIPEGVLPHLKWLTKTDYLHSYYVDGQIDTYDVKIFDDDSVHPGGWGTIAVASMGSGGFGQIIEHEDVQIITGSSYFILDVTDPEIPPVVLAQISDSDLGYTHASAEFVLSKDPFTEELNWNMIFASGVTDLTNHKSDQSGKIIIFDLVEKTFEKYDTQISSSYLSDMTLVDYNQDAFTDVLYFGLNQTGSNQVKGSLWRFHLSDLTFSQLVNVGKPISTAPLYVLDSLYNSWLFFGTGRYEKVSDAAITNDQQYFMGVKEPVDDGVLSFDSVLIDELFDTTDILHLQSGKITDSNNSAVKDFDGNELETASELKNYIQSIDGWTIRLNNSQAQPSGLNLNQALQYNELLMFNQYLPSSDSCNMMGNSILQYVDFRTGIAASNLELERIFGDDTDSGENGSSGANPNDNNDKVIINTLEYTDVLSNSPVLNYTDQSAQILVNGSDGSLTSTSVNSKQSPPKRVGWQQLY